MKLAIYLHRNDLRVHDNLVLHAAKNEFDMVLPVYVVDSRQFRKLPLGFRKTSYKRFHFLGQSLEALRHQYLELGANLMICQGQPEQIIAELAKTHGAAAVLLQAEVADEEILVERALEQRLKQDNISLQRIWGKTLYHQDDLPFSPEKMPTTSKSFRIRAQKEAGVRDLLPPIDQLAVPNAVSDWGEFPNPVSIGFSLSECISFQPPIEAGEAAALKRLDYYTFETQLIERYKWTRNRSLGPDYSSKLSAWLNIGSLSSRMVYHQVKRYEKEVKRNISTWWLIFEVVWRDYFIFSHLKHGNRVFQKGGIKNREVDWKYDQTLFERWCKGQTGIPFADAHLRELANTGFMSNRGRVNTASFLSRDYQIDWRWGAAWFESQLLDYEPSVNWFNWNTQATEIYYTNPVHQSLKYDKKGEYILSQLPELAQLPYPFFHAPWLAVEYEEIEQPLDYPAPAFVQKKWGRSLQNIKKEVVDFVEKH